MAIRFVGIDDTSGGNNCPAVFTDDETGDLLLQGWLVTDPAEQAAMEQHSPLGEHEVRVRLPARMQKIIQEACNGDGAAAAG
ncbi:MAG: hypothetical protein GEV11_26910 [Streptosporangiales bacterium]|nr:hypothetical protein [Streptosporangiales bacterium]